MKEKLSRRAVLSYGAGGLSRQFSGAIQSTFLLYYFVNVAGLKATPVGIMMMLAKIWDAINDPIMGTIVDNTHSRYGKVRPYLLYCAVPLAIFFTAMFAIPQSLGPTAKMVWATIAYVGTGMLLTMTEVPSQTLLVRMTDDSSERMRLSRSKALIGTIGVIAPGALIPVITGNAQNEWLAYALCIGGFALCIAVCYLIVFTGVRETATYENENKLTVFSGVKVLIGNKYYRRFIYSYLLYGALYAANNGAMMFYLTAKYHSGVLTSVLTVVMLIGMIGSSAYAKRMADKYGKIKTSIIGFVITISGMALRVLTGDAHILILIFGILCLGVGSSLYSTCLQPMIGETVDYGELKTGIRVESLSFAGLTLTQKVGEGVSTALVAILLDYIGYVENAAEQTQATIAGLRHISATIPMLLSCVIVVLFLTNDIDKKYPQYMQQLKERRAMKK